MTVKEIIQEIEGYIVKGELEVAFDEAAWVLKLIKKGKIMEDLWRPLETDFLSLYSQFYTHRKKEYPHASGKNITNIYRIQITKAFLTLLGELGEVLEKNHFSFIENLKTVADEKGIQGKELIEISLEEQSFETFADIDKNEFLRIIARGLKMKKAEIKITKYEDIIRLKYLTKGVFNLGKAQKPRLAIANQGFLQRSIG